MTQLDDLAAAATAAPIAPPPTIDALRRRARQRTRRLLTSTIVCVLVVGGAAIGLLAAASSSPSSSRSIVANPGPDESTGSTPTPTFTPEQIDALLTPITPDDYLDGTRNLLDFQGRANIALMQECVAAKGHPGSMGSETGPTIGDMHSSFQNFDSPELMRQYGYGVVADSSDPLPAGKTPQDVVNEARAAAPPEDVQNACSDEVNAATARVQGFAQVFYDWTRQVDALESSDTMTQAWRAWGTCMSDAGYDVAGGPPVPNVAEGGDSKFRSLVTSAMWAPGANAGAVEVDLATIDANCLDQTVVPVRAQARPSARAQFIAANRDAFDEAESDLVPALRELGDKSGVPYARQGSTGASVPAGTQSETPPGVVGSELPLNQDPDAASDSLTASILRREPGADVTLVRMADVAPILVQRGATGSNITVVDESGTLGTYGGGFTNDRDLDELISVVDTGPVELPASRYYFAWTRVPTGAVYVTIQYGDEHAWQRPVAGVAYWTLQSGYRPPLGPESITMRAFDSTGAQVGEATKTPIQDATGAWTWVTR